MAQKLPEPISLTLALIFLICGGLPTTVSGAVPGENVPVPFHRFLTTGTIRAYQLLISPARGTACPMHPNCSRYGMQAFRHLDPLTAIMRTADRLNRCGHDLEHYGPMLLDGYVRYYDPHPELVERESTGRETESGSNFQADSPIQTAGRAESWTEESALGFSQGLLQRRSYDLAILEFRRFLFLFPDSKETPQAFQGLFHAHLKMGDYPGALRVAGEAAAALPDSSNAQTTWHYNRGIAYYRLKNYPGAIAEWRRSTTALDDTLAARSPLLIGLAQVSEFDWEEAAAQFGRVSGDNPYALHAERCGELAVQGLRLPHKSPTLAGVLSIVPGGGYLYAGYPRTALSAFIVNGLFMWGTVRAFDSGNSGLGIFMGAMSFGWYTGNIYGGVRTARQRNLNERERHLLRFNVGFSF